VFVRVGARISVDANIEDSNKDKKKNSLSGGGIRLATVLGLDQLIMAHQGRLNPLKIKFITLRK